MLKTPHGFLASWNRIWTPCPVLPAPPTSLVLSLSTQPCSLHSSPYPFFLSFFLASRPLHLALLCLDYPQRCMVFPLFKRPCPVLPFTPSFFFSSYSDFLSVFFIICLIPLGFLGGIVVKKKNPPANVGDAGSIPRLGRSLGVGNGNQLQYSCLENSMDRGAWQVTVHGVAKGSDST